MKLSTSLIVVALTAGVVLLAYPNQETNPPQPLQANIVESLPEPEPEPRGVSQAQQVKSSVQVTSTDGLSEEWNSIQEGYAEIQSDFDRLESPQTATGASN